MSVTSSNDQSGLSGIQGGYAPLDSGLLIPRQYLGGAWDSFTPVLTAATTNPTVGNGSLTGAYRMLDSKTLMFWIRWLFGSTSNAGSGGYTLALAASLSTFARSQAVSSYVLDSGTAFFSGTGLCIAGTRNITPIAADGTGSRQVSNTVPMTWANTDEMVLQGVVEVA